jgi:hypothetical protein
MACQRFGNTRNTPLARTNLLIPDLWYKSSGTRVRRKRSGRVNSPKINRL